MSASVEGIRVVRGPDWSLGQSDGGEGHVGAVTKVNADHTVDVQWDMGDRTTCMTGKGNKHDLRVLDSAPTGVRHSGFKCGAGGCDQTTILGTRWRCTQCTNFDLCSRCYFKDKHNIQHVFNRHDAPGLDGVRLDKRSISDRIRSWGSFEEATVKRGPDWSYGDRDGGCDEVGTVRESKQWSDSHGDRDAVSVSWPNGHSDIYRLGYSGKVDLICVEATPGTDYYREHLLALNTVKMPSGPLREKTVIMAVSGNTFRKGDRVCIHVPDIALKEAQKGHGGWSVRLSELIGEAGVVKKVAGNGDVFVEFDDTEYQLFSGAIRKVPVVKVGDKLRILDDTDKVQAMQKGHGGWVSDIAQTLGKVGKVVKIDSDGDVAVAFGGTAFVYNPACCIPVTGNQTVDIITSAKTGDASDSDDDDDDDDDDTENAGDRLGRLMAQLFLLRVARSQTDHDGPQQFLSAAANNNAGAVQSFIQRQPDIVNVKVKGLTALIIASHEGHLEVVRALLKGKAALDDTTESGSTALMAALQKKREDVARTLMEAGANVNSVDANNGNALHHAALAGANNSLQLLIKRKCDVNQQDSDGDTPVHCAIHQTNSEGVSILVTAPTINLSLCNNKGYNPVHLAAGKDDEKSLSILLAEVPQLLNTPDTDGFTPLHVAAVNNTLVAIKTLLKQKANTDAGNCHKMSPLNMACVEGHLDAAKLLVDAGASLTSKDAFGDTSLHNCLMGNRQRGDMQLLVRMIGLTVTTAGEIKERIQLAIFLIERGADMMVKNNNGKQPLECCANEQVKDGVQKYVDSREPLDGRGDVLLDFLGSLLTTCYTDDCDRKIGAVFTPCGHKVCCQRCSIRFDECPLCDKPIVERRTLEGKHIKTDGGCVLQ